MQKSIQPNSASLQQKLLRTTERQHLRSFQPGLPLLHTTTTAYFSGNQPHLFIFGLVWKVDLAFDFLPILALAHRTIPLIFQAKVPHGFEVEAFSFSHFLFEIAPALLWGHKMKLFCGDRGEEQEGHFIGCQGPDE